MLRFVGAVLLVAAVVAPLACGGGADSARPRRDSSGGRGLAICTG